MIKTAMGNKINPDTLQKKIQQVVAQEIQIELSCIVELSESEQVLILIDHYTQDIVTKIVNLVKNVIAEYQVIDHYLIANINNRDIVYFSLPQVNDHSHDKLKRINEQKVIYKSGNFSVGFFVFLSGIIFLGIFGVSYYFTRPCVLGDDCALITETKTASNNLFTSLTQDDLTKVKVEDLIAKLVIQIQRLEKIPSWSKYHPDAQALINIYRSKINDLQLFLKAEDVANNARNMSKNLPLSVDEWNRVQGFWQEAIASLQLIKNEEFKGLKQEKIASYQQQLSQVETQINREKLAINKLETAENIVKEIKSKEANIQNLQQLKDVEIKWRNAIATLEEMPNQTTIYLEKKESLIKDYLQEISQFQQKINQEEKAIVLKNNIAEKVKLAQESEQENQWTKAVNYWQEVISLSNNISPESFLKIEIDKQKNSAEEKLKIAQELLKKAVNKQEINAEVKKICDGKEKICSFIVSDNNIKVFLTYEYMKKLKSLSVTNSLTNNNQQSQQVINHINQVEKNYQYLSSKYKLPVEVYNPQQQLIMIYNNYL